MVDVIQIPLPDGKKFTVKADGLSDENIYIKSVKIDGIPYYKSYITHDHIMQGSEVVLEMTSTPAKAWYTQNN